MEYCGRFAEEGLRVLVLAHSVNVSEGAELPEGLEPVGLLLITDVIRAEAPDTLAYFESQGVDLKVISGDDPMTVSAIARRAGLKMQSIISMRQRSQLRNRWTRQLQNIVCSGV